MSMADQAQSLLDGLEAHDINLSTVQVGVLIVAFEDLHDRSISIEWADPATASVLVDAEGLWLANQIRELIRTWSVTGTSQ